MGVKFHKEKHAEIVLTSPDLSDTFKFDPNCDFLENLLQAFPYDGGIRNKTFTRISVNGKGLNFESIIDGIIQQTNTRSVQFAQLAVKLLLQLPDWVNNC